MRGILVLVACLGAAALTGCSEPIAYCGTSGAEAAAASDVCAGPVTPSPESTPRPVPSSTASPWLPGEDALPVDFPRAEVPLPFGAASNAIVPEEGSYAFVLTVLEEAGSLVGRIDRLMTASGYERTYADEGASSVGRVYESDGWSVRLDALRGGVPRPRHQLPEAVTRINYLVTAR